MRTVVELDEKDIIQGIANAFNVDVCCVSLEYNEEWRGIEPNAYRKYVVSAKVVLKGGGAE